jgi:arsenate reductase
MEKTRVLFVCAHNSARSQIAEAFLNNLAGDRFDAHSAGLEPGRLNPLAIDVMKEIGIDISHNQTKGVFGMFQRGELFTYVITVCDEKTAEQCPVFPGITNRLHWSFEDPAELTGSQEEKMGKMREIRDKIRDRIKAFIVFADAPSETGPVQL